MRTLTYHILHPRGAGETAITGTVADLVREIPYLLAFDTIPPHALLNSVLITGREDAGLSGGCSWDSFELAQEQYDELCGVLAADGYHLLAPAAWVRTRADWMVYLDEVWNGVPASEMLAFHRELGALEQGWQKLEADGDAAGAQKLKLRALEVAEAINARRSAYGWRKDWKRQKDPGA